MHVASIEYRFKDDCFEEGVRLWKEIVLEGVRGRPGMVEFRLLENRPTLLAIGTWEDLSYARDYMATGVFQRFLSKAGALLEGDTVPPRGWSEAARLDGLCFGSAYREPPLPEGLDAEAFLDFLLEAKRATYASGAGPSSSSRAGSKDLPYARGDFSYLDSYLGERGFAGEEIAYRGGRPLWSMNYYGLSERDADPGFGDFLKAALRLPPREAPFRGPALHSEGGWLYLCRSEGGIGRFRGVETIHFEGRRLYSLVFHGGWLE